MYCVYVNYMSGLILFILLHDTPYWNIVIHVLISIPNKEIKLKYKHQCNKEFNTHYQCPYYNGGQCKSLYISVQWKRDPLTLVISVVLLTPFILVSTLVFEWHPIMISVRRVLSFIVVQWLLTWSRTCKRYANAHITGAS